MQYRIINYSCHGVHYTLLTYLYLEICAFCTEIGFFG